MQEESGRGISVSTFNLIAKILYYCSGGSRKILNRRSSIKSEKLRRPFIVGIIYIRAKGNKRRVSQFSSCRPFCIVHDQR